MQGDEAYIFYFTHPGRDGSESEDSPEDRYQSRRSSVQAARLDVIDGVLVCDRNEAFELKLAAEQD
ncbi:hypothetical protein D3C76_1505210 [compost metagenome]